LNREPPVPETHVPTVHRSRTLFLLASLAVLLPIATGVLWSAAASARDDDGEDSLYKYLAIFSEVFGLVRSSYVDAPDAERLMGGALDGVADALDPFSSLVPAADVDHYRRTLEIGTSRSGLRIAKDRGVAFVAAVEAGSPAATAGLQRGDLVAELGGLETRAAPLWRLESRLAAEPGTAVPLRLLREGESVEATITLAEFASSPPAVDEVKGARRLHLTRLDAATPGRVREILAGLAGTDRLLVDLRGVAGGDAEAAYAVGALFTTGALGRLESRGELEREFRTEEPALWRGRLVVLVDGGTLGAAEILAAVLHDGAGAELVGQRSFGWAGERSWVELANGARLHLTTAFYTGPTGESLSGGLAPDLLVDDLSRRVDEAERSIDDLILDRGIERLLADDETERRAA
jgi:carboxyl-terminal processing protease